MQPQSVQASSDSNIFIYCATVINIIVKSKASKGRIIAYL